MRSVMACAKFRAAGEVAVAEFRSSSGKPMHHASRNSLSLASDREKACPGLDPGWEPVFGQDPRNTKTWSAMTQREIIPR